MTLNLPIRAAWLFATLAVASKFAVASQAQDLQPESDYDSIVR